MLETLAKRLKQRGGIHQEQRMQRDKLQTLRKALLYSYQAATAVVSATNEDGNQKLEQFRCLINPDKLKGDYDNKILSIPYQDICLNEFPWESAVPGPKDTKLKPGDVFVWKETNTHWLLYLQYHEQDAYFRCDIRRCDQYVKVDGIKYWAYIRGPVQTTIQWNQKQQVQWNDINYSLVMYITKDQLTTARLHRFSTIKVYQQNSEINKTWRVAAINPYFGDGIIQVFLQQWFENQSEQARIREEKDKIENLPYIDKEKPYIEGPSIIDCYGQYNYSIKNIIDKGRWFLFYNNEKIDMKKTQYDIVFNVSIGKSGQCELIYQTATAQYKLPIQIKSI